MAEVFCFCPHKWAEKSTRALPLSTVDGRKLSEITLSHSHAGFWTISKKISLAGGGGQLSQGPLVLWAMRFAFASDWLCGGPMLSPRRHHELWEQFAEAIPWFPYMAMLGKLQVWTYWRLLKQFRLTAICKKTVRMKSLILGLNVSKHNGDKQWPVFL